MKSWKQYSLYYILKARWKSKFRKKTVESFFDGISDESSLSISLDILLSVFAILTTLVLSLQWWWILVIFIFSSTLVKALIAAADTYYTYKYWVRKKARISVCKIMEVELDRFGNIKKRKI